MANPDRLSPLDASFLHIEGENNPMHVGAVCCLDASALRSPEGWIDQERVVRHVASRLDRVPRFRQKVSFVPLGQGRPLWVDDRDFNIHYHVRFTALPSPGGDRELLALVGRLMSQALDRHKPLWEMYLVDQLHGDRVALVWKTHHCMVDGVSGMELATVLFDMDPEAPVAGPGEEWTPRPMPSEGLRLIDALIERSTERAEMYRTFRAALRAPRGAAKRVQGVAEAVSSFLGAGLAPKTCLNVPIGPHRRYETAEVPLADVKEIKNAFGGTVNDVVLAGCAGALRRFFRMRGEPVEDVELRCLVPVSVRSEDEMGALGNRVAAMLAPLDLGEADPRRRFTAIHEAMAELKQSPQVMGAEALTGLAGFAPATIMHQAVRVQSGQRFLNLCVTNVPGPQFPLYVSGAQLQNVFPGVPLMANLALGIGVISYLGKLYFGLLGDWDAMPDLYVLARQLEEAFDEMLAVARGELAPGEELPAATHPLPEPRSAEDPGPVTTAAAAAAVAPAPPGVERDAGAGGKAKGKASAGAKPGPKARTEKTKAKSKKTKKTEAKKGKTRAKTTAKTKARAKAGAASKGGKKPAGAAADDPATAA